MTRSIRVRTNVKEVFQMDDDMSIHVLWQKVMGDPIATSWNQVLTVGYFGLKISGDWLQRWSQ